MCEGGEVCECVREGEMCDVCEGGVGVCEGGVGVCEGRGGV